MYRWVWCPGQLLILETLRGMWDEEEREGRRMLKRRDIKAEEGRSAVVSNFGLFGLTAFLGASCREKIKGREASGKG